MNWSTITKSPGRISSFIDPTAEIDKIRAAARGYDSPGYNWTLDPGPATATAADVTVHLTMHTAAEQVAQMDLLFKTVYAHGWWVCEIRGT